MSVGKCDMPEGTLDKCIIDLSSTGPFSVTLLGNRCTHTHIMHVHTHAHIQAHMHSKHMHAYIIATMLLL